MADPRSTADLVVVGSGAAGLSAALRAAELGATVDLLTAGRVLEGSSPRAQGGVAAAVGTDDSPALHAADTLAVGGGLNDALAVDVLTTRGHRLLGNQFGFDAELGLEAGHSRRRILHAGGGATGRVLTTNLVDRVRREPRIRLREGARVKRLIRAGSRVVGARTHDERMFNARAVILATGGYAALWPRSTNAATTSGTGLTLAWRAGASLADLEFVQFHPTALCVPGQPAFLLSEALRGEGARLVDDQAREVVDPLLPRDVVARAIDRHIREHGRVFLDLRHLEPARMLSRFAALASRLRQLGLNLTTDLLPVAPAAHYCMGGVRTDTWGRSDVAGLYVAGEAACTGVQGANRLASNSLLECLVFAPRAVEAALSDSAERAPRWRTRELSLPDLSDGGKSIELTQVGVWLERELGVERDESGLRALLARLPEPKEDTPGDELLATLMARAALLRTESRGAHFRRDAPLTDAAWRGRIHWRIGAGPRFEEVT